MTDYDCLDDATLRAAAHGLRHEWDSQLSAANR